MFVENINFIYINKHLYILAGSAQLIYLILLKTAACYRRKIKPQYSKFRTSKL